MCEKNVVAFEEGYEEILKIIAEGESFEIGFRLAWIFHDNFFGGNFRRCKFEEMEVIYLITFSQFFRCYSTTLSEILPMEFRVSK